MPSFTMKAKYPTIKDLWDEWTGQSAGVPEGGVGGLEASHKARWRRHFDRAQKTHICRVKAVVRALEAKKDELGTVDGAIEWMERVYKDECRKSLSNLETWLKEEGLVGKRANRGRQSTNSDESSSDQ